MKNISKYMLCLWVAIIMLWPGNPATAQGWVEASQVQGRLLIADQAVTFEKRAVLAGLDLRLSENWHTYWRVPGDSGLPPQLDWTGSDNVENVEILWPAPTRMQEGNLTVFAYSGEVFLPLLVTRKDENKPFSLALKAQIMVCHDVCIPEHLMLNTASSEASSENARRIEMALRRVPITQDDRPDIGIDTVVLGPNAIAVSVRSKKGFTGADLFAHAGDYPFTAKPEFTVDTQDKTRAMVRLPATPDIKNVSEFMSGKPLSLTLAIGNMAAEKNLNF
jgi:suppressor for copper-sensitivity B